MELTRDESTKFGIAIRAKSDCAGSEDEEVDAEESA